jgi:hypothetical protein
MGRNYRNLWPLLAYWRILFRPCYKGYEQYNFLFHLRQPSDAVICLVRSKLECASVTWNSVMITDSNTLERIQGKFASPLPQ